MVRAILLLGLLPLVPDSISCFSFMVLDFSTLPLGASSFSSSVGAPFVFAVEALEPLDPGVVTQFLATFDDFGFEDEPLPVMV